MPNSNKTETEYWLALKLVPRLAAHKKIALVRRYGLKKLFTNNQTPQPVPLDGLQHQYQALNHW